MGSLKDLRRPPLLSSSVAESSAVPLRPTVALAHPLSLAPGPRPPAGGGALYWVTSTFSTTASPGPRGGSEALGALELSSPGILGLVKEKWSQREAEIGRPCGSLLGTSSASSLRTL